MRVNTHEKKKSQSDISWVMIETLYVLCISPILKAGSTKGRLHFAYKMFSCVVKVSGNIIRHLQVTRKEVD